MAYNPFLSQFGTSGNLSQGIVGSPLSSLMGGGSQPSTARAQPPDPWETLAEQVRGWTPETRQALDLNPWGGRGSLSNAWAAWGPAPGLGGAPPGSFNELALKTRDELWNDYAKQLAAGTTGLMNPDEAAIRMWQADPFGYSNASQNIAGIMRRIQEQYYNQDPYVQTRGSQWSAPADYADFERNFGNQQAQTVQAAMDFGKKESALKKYGPMAAGLALAAFGIPAGLASALNVPTWAAQGLLGAGVSALGGGNPLVGGLTGALGGAFGGMGGEAASGWTTGAGESLGGGLGSAFGMAESLSPLMQMAAAGGDAGILGGFGDYSLMGTTEGDMGLGKLMDLDPFEIDAFQTSGSVPQMGGGYDFSGMPGSESMQDLINDAVQAAYPGGTTLPPSAWPQSIGPGTADPSLARQAGSAIGLPEDWMDTIGKGFDFFTQDPLGRTLGAGTLAYLSNQSSKNAAEEAQRQAAATQAAARSRFDTGPVSGAVRSNTRQEYTGAPTFEELMTYGQLGKGHPGEREFFRTVPAAAFGGSFGDIMQRAGGGHRDRGRSSGAGMMRRPWGQGWGGERVPSVPAVPSDNGRMYFGGNPNFNELQPPNQPTQPIMFEPQPGGMSKFPGSGGGNAGAPWTSLPYLSSPPPGDINQLYLMAEGGPLSRLARGRSSGQADDVPALLSPGEYVVPADVVSDLGDGSNEAGARQLDSLRSGVRRHKGRRKGMPPKARAPETYMKRK